MVDQALLSRAVARLANRFHPDRIILFGSQARGTADAHSNVDILVISRFSGKRREILTEMYRELRDSGLAVEIILMTPEEYDIERYIPGTIARPASKEGIVLYEGCRATG